MSLLPFSVPQASLSPFPSASPCSSITMAVSATPASRLHFKPIELNPKSNSCNGFLKSKRNGIIVKASSEEAAPAESNGEEKAVAVDKLPLESKLKEREEQKLKMKLARKIRLRRKRLVRKRRLRKKGRWPPSKMAKLKNV